LSVDVTIVFTVTVSPYQGQQTRFFKQFEKTVVAATTNQRDRIHIHENGEASKQDEESQLNYCNEKNLFLQDAEIPPPR
jgi:hypothetical protein